MGSSSDVGFVSPAGDKKSPSLGMESMAKRPCTVVLEEKTDIYQPTEEELLEYARWLGMKIPQDMDLIWIARDGLTRPLPEEWKPCQTEDDEIYYFNFETGESVWDHPCDGMCRKLYQEECMRLGKRPYQMVENRSCSSHLQQLSNWGDKSTHTEPPRQGYFDEMVDEKEMHSPTGSFCQALSPQESMQAENLPSSKEIQMNIVEKEIDALKDIRAQLLQKMSALWQEEDYIPLANQMAIEGVANYNEPEQANISLLEGSIYVHPSAEVGNLIKLQPQQIGQDWSNGQHEEEKEDRRKTKERTELLHTQLEMAKFVKLQIPNKIGVADIYNVRKPYKDQIHESESSSRPPKLQAHEVSQEANSEANGDTFSLDGGANIPPILTTEESKKANLAISDKMKEKFLFQLSNIDGMERSTLEDKYQLALSRKKEKIELLRKELRKDMELQLLLEEESILKTKREETLARLHNQIEGEGFAKQGKFYGISPYLHSISKAYEYKSKADEDSKELFIQWTKELKDEVVSLKTKMNEILILHANTNQEQLESLPILPVTSEDICKASSDMVPLKKNPTEFIYTLRKILGELDVNLKSLLKSQGIGSICQNSVSDIVKKLEDIGLSKNLDIQPNLLHKNHNIVKTQDTSPCVMFTRILSILKQFLVVLDEEMEKNINHYDEAVDQNEKPNYCSSKIIGDEELDLKNNHILPNEIVNIIKGIITKIETHTSLLIMRQERGSLDKAIGLESASIEFPSSNDGLQPQSNFLNEDTHKMILDIHGMITQFKAVYADILSSLKEHVGELEGQMKESTQQPKRKVNYEVHGFKPQYVEKGDGHHKSRGKQILPKVDDTRETLKLTSEEIRSLEGLSSEKLDMLEGFIGTLHQELKDRIFHQGKKVQKDYACTQINAKPIFKHDTDTLQLPETSLQEDQSIFSEDEIRNKLTIPKISFGALSTNILSSLKGFVDELHRETTSSIQPKTKNIEDRNLNYPARSTLEETHVSIPYRGKHEVGFISPKNDCEEVPQEQNSELHTLSTKFVSAFENLRKNLDKEICDNVVEEGEPSIEKNSNSHILDGPSASFLEETDFGTWDKSITCNRFEKYLDAKSIAFDVMFMELKIFVGKVEEDLKNTIKNFKTEFKQENDGMRSKRNNIEVHELFSQIDKSELHSHSLIQKFKAWSIQIENSIEEILQHFQSKLMEEMNMLQQKKMKDPCNLRSINCHELQSPKSEHLTQVQTLVAEEKRVWYDILNNATKRWLQKEWVERLEHQSELTTTRDHSTSPPSSEHLTQVQKVFGEEKNIMFDILNHSTHKWVVQHRNPLQLGSKRTSHGKEGMEVLSMSHKGHLEYGQSPPLPSKVKYCHISEEPDIKKNGSRKRSHKGDLNHGDEDEQSKLFTSGTKVVEFHPHNFDSCPNQSKSAQEDGNIFSHEYEELEEYEEDKLPNKNSKTRNNLSSISQWIPKFGALDHANSLCFPQDGETCEDYHKQNFISQAKVFPPLHESYKDPSFRYKANNMQPCGLSSSKFDKNSKLYLDGNQFECASTGEAQGIYDKIRVPRSINQLKLVSRKGWKTLQSKVRVDNAKRLVHIIVSWTFQQISCDSLPRIDTSYLANTILKFIKTTIRKMACGERHQSPNAETFQANTSKDYDAKDNFLDGSKVNIVHISPCNPLMKPHVTRSGQLKLEIRDKSRSLFKEEYYDKHNPSTQDENVTCNSNEWKKLDYSPKIGDRNEFQWNNYEEFHQVESITDSIAKFQCDNDLEMSVVENTQCDCETPIMRGVNSKEVDMHELEEAINNLRKSKEIEAKGMAFKIDPYPLSGKDFEDERSHPPNTKKTPFQQRENIFAEKLDLTNGIHVDNYALCNGRKHQENGTNGSLKGNIPNFITFEFLKQGEIAFPKSKELKTH